MEDDSTIACRNLARSIPSVCMLHLPHTGNGLHLTGSTDMVWLPTVKYRGSAHLKCGDKFGDVGDEPFFGLP